MQTMCTRQYKWDYSKVMDPNIDYGSSCSIHRVKSGVIVKVPRRMWWSGGPDDVSDLGNHDKASFEREEKILDRLGVHPRIVQCVSYPDSQLLLRLDLTLIVILVSPKIPGGFYLRKQAMELWEYIKSKDNKIEFSFRLKWRSQAAEAVEYLHQNGIIHCDIRPDNFLLHGDSEQNLDLLICDFGGSSIDGQKGETHPSAGFGNPSNEPHKLGLKAYGPAMDIFALGSTFYVIMTGYYPHRSSRRELWTTKDVFGYEAMVERRFDIKDFPPTENLVGGNVILGCWSDHYHDMEAMIQAQDDCFAKLGGK